MIAITDPSEIPRFASPDEAAAFWDTHEITSELWDRLPNPDAVMPPHDWRDESAELLYIEAGARALVGAHMRLVRAVANQSAKLEQFSNTPFTEEQARTMQTTVQALRDVSSELGRWHNRIFPYLPEHS